MKRYLKRARIWLLQLEKGHDNGIPLTTSFKTQLWCAGMAILLAIIIGNAFMRLQYFWSVHSLEGVEVSLPASSEAAVDKLAELLPDYKNHLSSLSRTSLNELDTLFEGNKLSWGGVKDYLTHKTEQFPSAVEKQVHGTLTNLLFPTFKRAKITEILKEYGYLYKPNSSQRLSEQEVEYFIIVKLISLIRTEHKNLGGVNLPYWCLIAFGDIIQWLIFIDAIFICLLLGLKLVMIKEQEQLIQNGQLLGNSEEGNLWKIEASDQRLLPLFNRLSRSYPNKFLSVRLIEQVFRLKSEPEKPVFEIYIKDYVSMLSVEAEEGYHTINVGWDFAPAMGFIGTITGATLAFGHASGLLNETESLFQGIEMTILTNDLSVSFFTTLVGLLASLVISVLYARTKTAQAKMLQQLESAAIRHLKRFWHEQ